MKRKLLVTVVIIWSIIWLGVAIPLLNMDNVSRDNDLSVPLKILLLAIASLVSALMVGLHSVGFDVGRKLNVGENWSCVIGGGLPVVIVSVMVLTLALMKNG